MIERFGKSFRDIEDLKTSFFDDNEALLARALRYADLYVRQPARTKCKVCDAPLTQKPAFLKNGIPYGICTNCAHLNGLHEDSDEFCAEVYMKAAGSEYAQVYLSSDREAFVRRREAIYTPKADFLLDVLRAQGENPAELVFGDMGAGAGYFVSALQERGVSHIRGFEVSETQVRLGNAMMPGAPLQLISMEDIEQLCASQPVRVISFIGVLEHLQKFRAVLQAIQSNKTIKYLYFSLPLMSFSVFNEMAFPHVFPRHLSIGHTHLYTPQSINHFAREFGFEAIGAWWFGTDMMDLYRSLVVSLKDERLAAGPLLTEFSTSFPSYLDDLQLVLDKRRSCSQVHMVMRVH